VTDATDKETDRTLRFVVELSLNQTAGSQRKEQ